MRFSGFEPRGRLKQQIRFRRPFFQQATTAIRQKQPTATPISAARPDKPPSEAAEIPPSKVRSLSAKAYRQKREEGVRVVSLKPMRNENGKIKQG